MGIVSSRGLNYDSLRRACARDDNSHRTATYDKSGIRGEGERTSLIYRLTRTCRRVGGRGRGVALSGIIRDEIVITAPRDAAARAVCVIKLPINRWRKRVEAILHRRRIAKWRRGFVKLLATITTREIRREFRSSTKVYIGCKRDKLGSR